MDGLVSGNSTRSASASPSRRILLQCPYELGHGVPNLRAELMKRIFINRHTRHVIRHALGWLFLVLGIAGCFLPILQGILFLGVGIWLLADYIPWFAKLRDYLKRRFPRAHHTVESFKEKAKKQWTRRRKKEPPSDSDTQS